MAFRQPCNETFIVSLVNEECQLKLESFAVDYLTFWELKIAFNKRNLFYKIKG